MDFDLDKNSQVEAKSCCDATASLQIESQNCLLMDSAKASLASSTADCLPSIKLLAEKEEALSAKTDDELSDLEMSRRRRRNDPYPYPFPFPGGPRKAPGSHVGGTRIVVRDGQIVVNRN